MTKATRLALKALRATLAAATAQVDVLLSNEDAAAAQELAAPVPGAPCAHPPVERLDVMGAWICQRCGHEERVVVGAEA
jgi:hypothetical protein